MTRNRMEEEQLANRTRTGMGGDNSLNYYQFRNTADGGPRDVVGSRVGGLDYVELAVVGLVPVLVLVGWFRHG